MKKLKIYLDTSVISHLKQDDAPDKMNETLALWEDIKARKYEVYISEVAFDEVGRCKEDKLNALTEYLKLIEYVVLQNSKEIEKVANQIIQLGILNPKSFDDCLHIAHAVVSGCDYIRPVLKP